MDSRAGQAGACCTETPNQLLACNSGSCFVWSSSLCRVAAGRRPALLPAPRGLQGGHHATRSLFRSPSDAPLRPPAGCRPLGEQYAAMLTACSIGERIRDEGGHSLVVLNDASVMVRRAAGAALV